MFFMHIYVMSYITPPVFLFSAGLSFRKINFHLHQMTLNNVTNFLSENIPFRRTSKSSPICLDNNCSHSVASHTVHPRKARFHKQGQARHEKLQLQNGGVIKSIRGEIAEPLKHFGTNENISQPYPALTMTGP